MKAVEVELVAGTKEALLIGKLINYSSQSRVPTTSTDSKINENQADMLRFVQVSWNDTGTRGHKTELFEEGEVRSTIHSLHFL